LPSIAWYASFIFLGLSVSIGLLVYLILYGKKKKKGEQDLPPEIADAMKDSEKDKSMKELERKYGKRG